ncbi:MAG: uracil-DNA glycosylase [Candidatus Omnitrophica bacterium]|nr:uracil-DNA glycosylase [Candidatus Omnitrophota bacterium]MBI3009954.1 uracil-DNA glycosylase [Candidatus Omnitrophota bacterium]
MEGQPVSPPTKEAQLVLRPDCFDESGSALVPSGPIDQLNLVEALAKLSKEVSLCQRCPLYRTRTHPVVSDGSPSARLVFVGEAPGREEDLRGIPFVGAAGQLLTKMIEAMGFKRQDVYICNVLKDRPPGNRTPLPEEMEACLPFLKAQLAIVQPRVICVLGAIAAKALLGPHVAITKIRGTLMEYEGIPVIPTFHPAYLLRNPPAKKFAWEDLKRVKQLLEIQGQGAGDGGRG